MSSLVVQVLQAFLLLSHLCKRPGATRSDQERPGATRSDQDPEIEDDRRCLGTATEREEQMIRRLQAEFEANFTKAEELRAARWQDEMVRL